MRPETSSFSGVAMQHIKDVQTSDFDLLLPLYRDATCKDYVHAALSTSPLRFTPVAEDSNWSSLRNSVQVAIQRALQNKKDINVLELGSIKVLGSVQSTLHLCELLEGKGNIITVDIQECACDLTKFICGRFPWLDIIHGDLYDVKDEVSTQFKNGIDLIVIYLYSIAEPLIGAFEYYESELSANCVVLFQSNDLYNNKFSSYLFDRGWEIENRPYGIKKSGIVLATRRA